MAKMSAAAPSILAASVLLFVSATAHADAITFDFSFTGPLEEPVEGIMGPVGTGTVTGQILGLQNDEADQTPMAIYVTSFSYSVTNPLAPLPIELDLDWPSPLDQFNLLTPTILGNPGFFGANTFTVENDVLTSVDAVLNATEDLGLGLKITPSSQEYDLANDITDTTIYALSATFTPVSAVPEPATLPLLGTGLGVLGLLGWRRNRKAQALAS